MTDLPTVRATGPADLLALVPGFLGFHPEDSVVLITVGDARQPFHARVDLPTDHVGIEELAAYLTRVAVRGGVRRVAVVVYSDDAALADELAEELTDRLEEAGVVVACGVRADGERWWGLGVESGPGTPYDLSCHPLMAQAVVDGTVVLASRRALADTLVGDPAAVERVASCVDDVVARLGGVRATRTAPAEARADLVAEGLWVREQVRRHLESGSSPDDPDVARLVVLFALSVEVRDVAWAEMDRAGAARHVDLWRDVVRRTPPDLRAAPAALLAFAAWLSGNGALSWCAVDLAQEAQPDYGLARLICHALSGAVPPTAWQPLSPDAVTLFRM